MKWFTEVEAGRSRHLFSYKSKMLFLGSCFSEEIGTRMMESGFNVLVNPFGVLYNPASIALSLKMLSEGTPLDIEDLVKDGSVYKSIYHSGDFSSMEANSLIENINSSLLRDSDFMAKADTIALTFGTTWIYTRQSDGRVVSNCHKQPASAFVRTSMSVDECYDAIAPFIEKMAEKKWFMSVSPVRHLKDGAVENMASKSRLILAIHKLAASYENVIYFPSFEIVMDQLRDYRFYSSDLLHLSKDASDYIWERFSDFALDDNSRDLLKDYKRLADMKKHRPLFPESPEYKEFLKRIEEFENILIKKRN